MRLPNFAVRAGLVVAALALLPTTILAQGVESREYQLRQLAGQGLQVRGFTAEAFYILETLGDDALLAGDTTGAIESYRHAAWIAADAARGANIAFDPRIPGWRDDRASVQTAAAEAERVLNKAVALGGDGSAAVAPRRIDADPGDWETGIEVGRVLSALGQVEMAVMVYEIVGDEALAAGDAAMAERAFNEGSLLAYEQYLRLSLNWTPRIQGARTDFIPMRDTAERLADKAERAGR
jgi:hypothetical protein